MKFFKADYLEETPAGKTDEPVYKTQ